MDLVVIKDLASVKSALWLWWNVSPNNFKLILLLKALVVYLFVFLGAFAFMYLIGYINQQSRIKQNKKYQNSTQPRTQRTKFATSAIEILGKHDSHKVKVSLF